MSKEVFLHLDCCLGCPYMVNDGHRRELCRHPEIGGRIIEKPAEVGAIPGWCPLEEVGDGSAEMAAFLEAKALPDTELVIAMVAEILAMVDQSGLRRVNPRVIALKREAERRIAQEWKLP